MEDLQKKYKETLEKYQWMVTQKKFNRGGNDTVIKLLKLELEQLAQKIQSSNSYPFT